MPEATNYHIVVTGPPMADEAVALLTNRATIAIVPSPPSTEQILDSVSSQAAEGMIIRQGKITREVLQASPRLGVVVKHGVGVDNIDVQAATELGIPVCFTPKANYESVAEHALMLMLTVARNTNLHGRRIRNGDWDKKADVGSELYRKTLGIIGLGRAGRRLAELVRPLEMNILGFDPYLAEQEIPPFITRFDSIDPILSEVDYLSLHCPRTPETVGLIGERELRSMKTGAVIINTARGGIVDDRSLARALEQGWIGGAGLDCFSAEPLPTDDPFRTFGGRLVLTPHIGGVTHESLSRVGTEAVQTLLDYLDGKELDPAVFVNPSVLDRSMHDK